MPVNFVSFEGRLVADPELRFTASGVAVANFRMGISERAKDSVTGEWKDGESLFMTFTAWRDMAENVCEHLQKGALAVVTGRLRQRSYETKEGEKRTVYEVEADSVGPSLKWKDKTGARGGSQVSNGGYSEDAPPF